MTLDCPYCEKEVDVGDPFHAQCEPPTCPHCGKLFAVEGDEVGEEYDWTFWTMPIEDK